MREGCSSLPKAEGSRRLCLHDMHELMYMYHIPSANPVRLGREGGRGGGGGGGGRQGRESSFLRCKHPCSLRFRESSDSYMDYVHSSQPSFQAATPPPAIEVGTEGGQGGTGEVAVRRCSTSLLNIPITM